MNTPHYLLSPGTMCSSLYWLLLISEVPTLLCLSLLSQHLWRPMPHFPVTLGNKKGGWLSSLIFEPCRSSRHHPSASPPVLNAKRFCSLPLSHFSATAKTLQAPPAFLDDSKLWFKVPLAFHNCLLPPALPLTLYVHYHCFYYLIL